MVRDKETYLLTTFVALPLLDLQCQVKGADGEVDSLGVHSSHLADKRGSQITFQRLPRRTARGRGGEGEKEREFVHLCHRQTDRQTDQPVTAETSAGAQGVFGALRQGR